MFASGRDFFCGVGELVIWANEVWAFQGRYGIFSAESGQCTEVVPQDRFPPNTENSLDLMQN